MDDRSTLIQDNMVVLAKSKKAKMRSKMLKLIMPLLSQEHGEKLAVAIQNGNRALFDGVWHKIQQIIDEKLDRLKVQASNCCDIEAEDMYALLTEDFDSLAADTNEGVLLSGTTKLSALAQQLAAEGRVILNKEGCTYSLTMKGIQVEASAGDSYALPLVRMTAELKRFGYTKSCDLHSVGQMGRCYMDLVIQATHT